MDLSEFRIIAPPHAPFDASGNLNLAVVEKQARWFEDTGVDGVFVAGTTGECSSLTLDERIELTRCWIDASRKTDLDVIVQVGDPCQANAVRLAQEAQRAGADATAALAPYYFKPDDTTTLIEFLAPIAAAASDLPFYFYDIPPMTGVRLNMVQFLEQAKPRIPNLVGLKYSNSDLLQLQECLQLQDGEFEVLFGCDEFLLSGVVLGVHGAIGSTYNFAAPMYLQMLAALTSGDLAAAQAIQGRSAQLIRTLMRFGFMPACKAIMARFGVDCGPVRLPLRNLTPAQHRELDVALDRLDVMQWAQNPATRDRALDPLR